MPKGEPLDQRLDIASDVLFDVGSGELTTAANSQLNSLARLLRQHPHTQIEIVGHTDATPGPTESYNYQLSLERAGSVQTWLISAGIEERRISIDGRGPDDPIASNDTEAGRAANRRVAIRIWEAS